MDCDNGRLCSLNNQNLYHIGVQNLNPKYDLSSFQRKYDCYKSIINETCLRVIKTIDKQSYVIIEHAFPDHINEIMNQISFYKSTPKIITYRNETIFERLPLIIKIAPIKIDYYRFTNYFLEPSETNICSNKTESICTCKSRCVACYDPRIEDSIAETIKLTNIYQDNPFKSARCNVNEFTTHNFDNIKFVTHLNRRSLSDSLSYNFNKLQPKLCFSIELNQNFKFKDDSNMFNMKINLIDYHLIAQTKYFNITYEVKLYFMCKYRTKNSSEFINGKLTFQKIINLNEEIEIDTLYEGNYAIELIPILKSSYCNNLCPFITSNGGLKCEQCKKSVHLFKIQSNKYDYHHESLKTCLTDHIDVEILKYDANNLSSNAIVNLFTEYNQTLVLDDKFSIQFPQDIKQCPSFYSIRIGKKQKSYYKELLTIGLLVSAFFLLIFLILLSIKFYIEYFYSKC